MPSRFGILTVLVFWVVTSCWLIVREVIPHFRTGEPPAYFTDVTDEVGGTRIFWNILLKGNSVGTGWSTVQRLPDRNFKLVSELRFLDFPVWKIGSIKKIAGSYLVDRNGSLKELTSEVRMVVLNAEFKGEVKGVVLDGILRPRIFINDEEKKDIGPFQPQPVPVAAHGNVLNTMHLFNRIPGLYAGRTWQVPLLDPLGAMIPGQKMPTTMLIAEVHGATLDWQGEAVACFRIDYSEAGKKAAAHTWVRAGDGLVLQQAASHNDMDLILVREPPK